MWKPVPIEVICAVCSTAAGLPCIFFSSLGPKAAPPMPTIASVSTIHSANWVRATRATPMILPNIRSMLFTDDTSTSTTRELFSSITEPITMPLNIAMNM